MLATILHTEVAIEVSCYDVYELLMDILSQAKDSNMKFIQSNKFHDRFIIIDKSILYHSGSSFKDLGKKCFAINKIEDSSKNYIIICSILIIFSYS